MKSEFLSKDHWINFIEETENFRKTCVFNDSFSEEDRELLYKGISESFFTKLRTKDTHSGFRLWLGSEQMSDNWVENFFNKSTYNENEDLIKYLERNFNSKFGFIINNNECFSDLLSSRVLQMVKPLCDLIGIPPLGFELTTFIGNYGWTPLGIHKDKVGENVIHFHIGPGRKQMYIWEDEKYKSLVGENVFNNTNIEPILENAEKYDFGSQDIFYMPWFENHIGYTEELSIGLTLWFKSSNNNEFTKQLIKNFLSQFLSKDNKMIPPQINYLENDDTLANFKNTVNKYMDVTNPNLEDFLSSIYSDYKFSIVSNGGWKNGPISNNVVDIRREYFIDKKVAIVNPFPILYKISENNKLYIFVRGQRIKVKYFEDLINFINLLNKNEIISLDEFKRLMKIPNDAFLYFVLVLYKFKGITIIK